MRTRATPAPALRSSALERPELHSAAQTAEQILKSVGSRSPNLTAANLNRIDQLLTAHRAKPDPRLDQVNPRLLKQLEQRVGELKRLVGSDAPAPPQPFCLALRPQAIARKDVRACAEALAVGCDAKNRLTFARLREALAFFHGNDDSTTTLDEDRKEELREAQANGIITNHALEALEIFFLTGQGGILCHGPVLISGNQFDDVFKLSDGEEKLAEAVTEFERKFSGCGYDRIYLKDPNNGLYVALNEKGRIPRSVREGFQCALPHESGLACSLEVLAVVDVPNSKREALLDPWRNTLILLSDAMSGALNLKATDGIKNSVAAVTGSGSGQTQTPNQSRNLMNLGVSFATLTAAGTFLAEAAVPVLVSAAGVACALTGVNAVRYLSSRPDPTAILHAVGVAVNESRVEHL